MCPRLTILAGILFALAGPVVGQERPSVIHGTVVLNPGAVPARNVVVTVIEAKRSRLTDEQGRFEVTDLAPREYHVLAHLDHVPEVIKTVIVDKGEAVLDFELTLTPVAEQVTVTTSNSPEAVSASFEPVASVSSIELGQRNSVSIGEALEGQLGIAKRSFGPGSGRPVIRGFDGDRVLVLQDGLRLGSIASQSADEVEPIDVLSLDRVEIVRGPATLLYGSNAIGGVVNGISSNDVYQRDLSGYLTTF